MESLLVTYAIGLVFLVGLGAITRKLSFLSEDVKQVIYVILSIIFIVGLIKLLSAIF